ncbi:hypothetical protein [Methylobacterium radiotolerans]|uniref:hypothetical protein n=1 Tax=Methylobacterium radiotolerans TaxID=31998 RepID=UPI001F424E3F|nr:hypothetical protein [Methylobacterium radiotolerans]UIY43253.1 hypothetical protein LZ599_05900 [Methylobacterium radiotolerans]
MKPIQAIKFLPNASFDMTEMALDSIGRSDCIRDITTPSEHSGATRPILPIPAGGIWNFDITNGKEANGYKLIEDALTAAGARRDFSLCLDCAGEGFLMHPHIQERLAIRFRDWGLNPNSTYLLSSRIGVEDYYLTWCKEHGYDPVFKTIYIPVQLYYVSGEHGKITDLSVLKDLASRGGNQIKRMRPKKYLSLNLSPRDARWALVLSLMDAGLMDSGLVSFYGRHIDNGALDAPPDLKEVRSWLERLQVPSNIIDRLPELDAATPIQLDVEPSSRVEKAYAPSFPDFYKDTYFSIVTESDFPGNYGSRFSEKVLKPFLNFHPFVLIGTPGVLAELRRLGFQTFHPYIDESYDGILDPAERLKRAIDVALELANRTDAQLSEFYEAVWPRLTHNFFHIIAGVPNLIETDRGLITLSSGDIPA